MSDLTAARLTRRLLGAALILACAVPLAGPAAQADAFRPASRPGPMAAPQPWRPAAPGTGAEASAAGLALPAGPALPGKPALPGEPALPAGPGLPAGLGLPGSAAAAGNGGWRPQFTPNPADRPNGSLAADSCTAASACTAVGNYFNSAGRTLALAERWNGSAWAIQPTPSPPGAGSSQLLGVSCTGARACAAAGYYSDGAGIIRPLAETWNGNTWTIRAVPVPAGARVSGFLAISCASAGACTAVGDSVSRAGTSQTLAERWNGTTWTIQATPDPAGATASGLFAVSCATTAACVAAGDSTGSTGATLALAQTWNGSAWAIRATPVPPGASSSQLEGVSCPAPGACTATGLFVNGASGVAATLAERWNGTTWAIQATPNPAGAGGSELGAVSCASASACTAAGASASAATLASVTLAETWNGSSWTIQPTPNPAGAATSGISGLSCPSAGACIAAGGYAKAPGTPLPLAETRTGSGWRLVSPAQPFGAKTSLLNGVACLSDGACTAVGSYNRITQGTATLAEARDGTRWSIQPTPVPAGSNSSYLQAVACPDAGTCVAVGYYYPHRAGPNYTLAEVRRGSTWSILPTPNPAGARHSWLYGVSCSTPRACVAVGVYDSRAGTPLGLAELWNGTTWRVIAPATPPGAVASSLAGVSCPSPRYCVAVGDDTTGTGQNLPLAEAWNGTGWRAQNVPLPARSQGGILAAVSCSAAGACTATGSLFTSRPALLAERWNGTAWAYQAVPNPLDAASSQSIGLLSAACASARACVATGNYLLPTGPAVFAEAWNGRAWRLRAISLPAGALGSSLYGASCTRADCTAVGNYFGGSNESVTLAVGTAPRHALDVSGKGQIPGRLG